MEVRFRAASEDIGEEARLHAGDAVDDRVRSQPTRLQLAAGIKGGRVVMAAAAVESDDGSFGDRAFAEFSFARDGASGELAVFEEPGVAGGARIALNFRAC